MNIQKSLLYSKTLMQPRQMRNFNAGTASSKSRKNTWLLGDKQARLKGLQPRGNPGRPADLQGAFPHRLRRLLGHQVVLLQVRRQRLAIQLQDLPKVLKYTGWRICRTVERLVKGRHCRGIDLNQRGETLAVPLLLAVHRVYLWKLTSPLQLISMTSSLTISGL